jgi:hypothetical protein
MATTFVVLGEAAPLKATLGGSQASTIDQVTFTIYRRGLSAEKVLDTIASVPVKKKVAEKDWTSKGLDDDEMQCTAYLRASAGKLNVSGADPIVIYRDTLTVVAKDDNGAPVKNALCQLTVNVDPAFTTTGSGGMTSRVARTDDTGTVEFANLAPGDIVLKWKTPWQFKSWTPGKDKGPNREVTLQRLVKAKILSHPSAQSPYKQYVNQPADPTHPELGQVVKVKVGVDPVSGPAQAGDKIYMQVGFWADNSARNDPLPKFEGTAGGKGKTLPAVAKTVGDDGTVEFTLDLGVPGGDHATVSVGGTVDCTDDVVVFENWRRIPTRLYYPAEFPLVGGKLPAGIESQVVASLGAAFIELAFLGATQTDKVSCEQASATAATKMGLPAAFVYYKLGGSPEKWLHNQIKTPESQFNILVGQYAIGWSTKPFKVEMTSWKSAKLSAPSGFLMPWCPDDTSPIDKYNEYRKASWSWNNGAEKGDVDPSWIKFDGGRDFHIELPRGQGLPGTLASKKNPVEVLVGIKVFNSIGGSSTGNWILTTWKDPSEVASATYTILHELGHSLGQAATSNADTPGLPATHPNQYDGHGHQGSHCSFGLPSGKKDTEDYGTLLLKDPPIHGKCIMWGGTAKGFRFDEANTFCADCTAYLLAHKIEKVGS